MPSYTTACMNNCGSLRTHHEVIYFPVRTHQKEQTPSNTKGEEGDTHLYLKEAETLHVEGREDRVFVAAIWRHQMGALPASSRTMAAFRFSLNPQGARGEGVKRKVTIKTLRSACFILS